ncbi:carbon-nitrogen hydrolase family protein [Vibrio sp. SS-MA-C1-2]|uniref:carbon-nitrogen hydrolase family protein n=1 Tax=Vibrio sp. SS-MA-C1-2 TaxID=2908646 RepID=UPI001F46ED7B|nr:carbon-nitrogen hydrolase family protein [Vibrio sp. SS-MA-C1-2]UJF20075.1 carbon-nitrogen hydrolase family protein [Vibrio sp. SS-MA-C1-2]
MTKVGVIQMNSGADPELNLSNLKKALKGVQLQGAELVVTPENCLVFGSKEDYQKHAEPLNNGPLQQQLSTTVKQLGIWLVVGSFPIRQTNGDITSTSLLFNPEGMCSQHYNKIHLFDVDIADQHNNYRESDTFTKGNQAIVADTDFGKLGLSICYDVRFPQLYSLLREKNAKIITIPAAFTRVTGQAHWETLLRARAIETQCWIIAAAQWGNHGEGRDTWGHSMIVDPWGRIVACQESGVGSIITDIDLTMVDTIRSNMPIHQHSHFHCK